MYKMNERLKKDNRLLELCKNEGEILRDLNILNLKYYGNNQK